MNRPAPPPAEPIRNAIAAYPEPARNRFLELRTIIYNCAERLAVGPLEETLKWGQPAYRLSTGSTLRLGYSVKNPDVLSIYFNCNTKLVRTFRELFGDDLAIKGNRELQIPVEGEWPERIVEECIRKTLEYHRLKHIPLLGG